MRGLLIVFATLQLVGCAVGVTHSLDSVNPNIKATSGGAVELAVQDKRTFVVSGEKLPSFIGLSRGGFGNPFDVNTTSGKALANDVSKVIENALTKNGIKVLSIEISPSTSEEKAVELLASTGNKSIFLKIISWKSDTYTQTTLNYNLELEILDKAGKILATNSVSGNESVSGPSWTAKDKVPPLLNDKIEMLFAEPKIASKL